MSTLTAQLCGPVGRADAAPGAFEATADGYTLRVGSAITLSVEHLRRERSELHGELTVECRLPGSRTVDGILSSGTLNLSSPRARTDRARLLADRARTEDGPPDWALLLESLVLHTLKAERVGQPAVNLAELPPRTADARHDLLGWTLPADHPSILFGDGGSLKSYLALWLAAELTRRGTRVGLLDFELDALDHRDRLARLYPDGPLPAVAHVRCDKPLCQDVDRLRRLVRDEQLGYAVVDSAGYACDGPPEGAEHALRFFQALRQVRVGSLILAHVNRSDTGDQKPFGSVFWANSARATWFVKRGEDPTSPDTVPVLLTARKNNLGALGAGLAFSVDFSAGRTRVRRVDAATVDDFAASLPLWQRLKAAVTHGPLTLAVLANDLGASVDSLDKAVRRHPRVFTRVDGEDGVRRVSLLEWRTP